MVSVRIGVSILAVAVGTVLAGCGDDDSVSQDELRQATTEAAQQARDEAKNEAELDDLREQIEELQKDEGGSETTTTSGGDTTVVAPSGGGVPSDAENCGAGIYARTGSTSCGFALNVANTYLATGSGTVEAFSPATGETYTMTCSGSSPVICTGGNNAAVYIP